MNYSDLVNALGDLLVVTITDAASAAPSNDPNFNTILPSIIQDAENRIYREVDPLYARQDIVSANFLANNRLVALPTGMMVLQGANTLSDLTVIASSTAAIFNSTVDLPLLNIDDSANPSVPFASGLPPIGSWINIPTTIFVWNQQLTPPQVRGPYQVASYGTTGFNISVTPSPNNSGALGGTAAEFSTTIGSVVVTVFMRAHGFSVGSIFTVGTDTTDGITTILAGDYIVTSVIDSADFTFDLPTPALSHMAFFSENNNVPILEYLGIQPSGNITATRTRLEIVSKDTFDIIWPQDLAGTQGIPKYGALLDNQTLIVGPTPAENMIGEFTGIVRPAPMSASNPTTYLGTTYPDVMLAACMVFGMLYQKDADQPPGAPPGMDMQKWESIYTMRRDSMKEEIARQKGQSQNWSNYQQTPLSTPVRP